MPPNQPAERLPAAPQGVSDQGGIVRLVRAVHGILQ